MTLQHAACIDDLAQMARRRLPRFAFDFLDGAAGGEGGLRRNRAAFDGVLLKPRYGVGVDPDLSVSLFGETYDYPFGISPVGLGNLAWPGAEATLAGIARDNRIPFVLSTVGGTAIEEAAAAAPCWFQLYVQRQEAVSRDLLRRAAGAGIRVLVVTVDIAASNTRRRDIRNRFVIPFRITPGLVADLLRHYRWSLATLLAGPPSFVNLAPYATAESGQSLAEFISSAMKTDLVWDDIRRLRDQWSGPLVVKGILAPEDAVLAVEAGADGIWVSNHGGRQLESAPAAIDAVAGVRAAVGPLVPVLMDSGVRTGEDMVKARLLGADVTFCGRAFYFGMAAGGRAGGERAMALLAEDLRRVMVQIGCPSFADLDGRWIWG
ncbi:MAG TPA: alpha-hydroxy-acid oxidizing protein [Rhodospirillaceae bacterium]|nr:alpha-hydroxy-acid oxidizing protein [Rhodospirillaceae bacterium]